MSTMPLSRRPEWSLVSCESMPLGPVHFSIIDLPPLSAEALTEFERLPVDPYTPGGQRFRRFSQYRIEFHDGEWRLEKLPHRPFIQSREYNSLVGGVPRQLEPLRIDPTPQINAGAAAIPLDPSLTYQINVHQCRVVASQEARGVSVPEGPHHDGHLYGLLAVFRRHNIRGGETQLFPNEGGKPFFRKILEPNQALVYEDAKMLHHATDIEALDADGGYRDLWIVAINEWSDRRYGREFEAKALAT